MTTRPSGRPISACSAFPQSVIERIGYYVYVLRDPRDGEVFYVGKGTGNRIFGHAAAALRDATASDKLDLTHRTRFTRMLRTTVKIECNNPQDYHVRYMVRGYFAYDPDGDGVLEKEKSFRGVRSNQGKDPEDYTLIPMSEDEYVEDIPESGEGFGQRTDTRHDQGYFDEDDPEGIGNPYEVERNHVGHRVSRERNQESGRYFMMVDNTGTRQMTSRTEAFEVNLQFRVELVHTSTGQVVDYQDVGGTRYGNPNLR